MSLEAPTDAVIWHDVECGAYEADLPLWEELAVDAKGPVLELGCGTGRVTLHLAGRGQAMTGIDCDPDLVTELRRRAAARGLDVRVEHGDAEEFSLDTRFALAVVPMQMIQLLPGAAARRRCLECATAHLQPGGRIALAIAEKIGLGIFPSTMPPDMRERDGWVYSSLPLGVRRDGSALVIQRRRQTVAPGGELRQEQNLLRLQTLSAAQLENEAIAAGLRPVARRDIEATEEHVGSSVVLLEA